MTEKNFLYAGDLEAEMLEISELDRNNDELEQQSSFSIECGSFFTIFCC
ncbi:hypothetical protein [Frisingicoccus sp.]